MKKVFSLLVIIAIVLSCLSGCADATETENTETRSIVDMLGNTVEIPNEVNKVFMHWASGVTLVMTLQATEKLAVIPTAFDTETFAWARVLCPQLSKIEKNDDAFKNTEVALQYDPDLIIANDKEIVSKYTDLGIPVIYVELTDYESYKKALLIVGEALGEEEYKRAEKYNQYFDSNVSLVKERLSNNLEIQKPSVYYLDSRFGDAYHTVGKGELQGDWISFAAGCLATENYFEGRNIEITVEKFLEIDPDIILIGGHNQAVTLNLLMNDQRLSELKAIKNNNVYRIPYGIYAWCREGAEAALQVLWIAKLLHPECFEDTDVNEVAKKFYNDFYGVTLSDEQINAILKGQLTVNGK